MKGGRSLSLKNTPKVGKEVESIRKELSNAYKQIDMYKNIVQDLKAKEVPLDHVDK
jgi:conjugal transfer/entry exclusion protein